MFIVHQDGDLCVKLEKVSYTIDWDDETKSELNDIHHRMYAKVYHYGNTDNCLRAIKREQDNYISYHKPKKILRIYVNKNLFATYKNIESGMLIFNNIIEGLENGWTLIDLSKKESQ